MRCLYIVTKNLKSSNNNIPSQAPVLRITSGLYIIKIVITRTKLRDLELYSVSNSLYIISLLNLIKILIY